MNTSNTPFQLLDFSQLDQHLLYKMLHLRSTVFIHEQQCVFTDVDGIDTQCLHLFSKFEDTIACYCRIVPPGIKYVDTAIERVVVRKSQRGKGHGMELVKKAIGVCEQRFPKSKIFISAQSYLKYFYESVGFQICGHSFVDQGIECIPMTRPLQFTRNEGGYS